VALPIPPALPPSAVKRDPTVNGSPSRGTQAGHHFPTASGRARLWADPPLGLAAPPPRNWGESQAELACEANRLMHELGCPLYGQPELKGAAVRLEALGSPSR
jgi:hypothetical protein